MATNNKTSFASQFGLTPKLLIVGLLLGLAIRLGMYTFVDYQFDKGDAATYRLSARNIVEHGVYSSDASESPRPNAYRPPLYSGFLAVISSFFADTPRALQLAQLLLSLCTGLLMTRISKVKFPEAAPWVFGLLMLSPFEAVYAGALLSETLTALLLVGAAASLLLLSGWKRWILGGMVGGLCVLCRDIYLPMLLLFAGLWTWRGIGPPKHRILQAGVFLAASMIVIAPWTARNYYYLGQVVPVSAGRFGFAMWIGTWATDGAFTKSDATGTRVYPPQAYRTENERRLVSQAIEENQIAPGKGDAIFRSLAMARLRDEPRRVLVRALRRAPLLWFGTRFDIFSLNERVLPYGSSAWRLVKSILWGINAFFIVLGVLGIILAARRSSSVLWLAVPIFFTVGVYLPFGAFENRYSQPVYPFVLAFSGIAAAEIVKCYSSYRAQSR